SGKRRAQRICKQLRISEPFGACTEALDSELCEWAYGIQPLDTLRTGAHSDFGVSGRRELAKLSHVADDQPPRAAELGGHLHSDLHGAGIRVVGIVDDPGAAERPLELQTARDRAHRA